MAGPPNEVDARISLSTRPGWDRAICWATAPPNDTPRTWAEPRPSRSRTPAPMSARPRIDIGDDGTWEEPMPGAS